MNKKDVKKEELEVANGGIGGSDRLIYCPHCFTKSDPLKCETRVVQNSGCTSYTQHKCPNCGEWID